MTDEEIEKYAGKDDGTTLAPTGYQWQCQACGKRSRTRYGFDKAGKRQAIDHGWDESCMMNAALVKV
jgi:hypothetical protein